jgi:hypothetical protein
VSATGEKHSSRAGPPCSFAGSQPLVAHLAQFSECEEVLPVARRFVSLSSWIARSITAPAQKASSLQPRTFTMDRVFPSEATQADVFAQVRPLVESVVTGFNATVLAYGSTGSGKTHTIMGEGGIDAAMEKGGLLGPGSGVLSRTISTLFSRIAERSAERDFTVKLSFVELYNNNFRDLLQGSSFARGLVSAADDGVTKDLTGLFSSSSSATAAAASATPGGGSKISVRESRSRGVYLEGSETLGVPVGSVLDCLKLIQL